jgi:hypothetical protein
MTDLLRDLPAVEGPEVDGAFALFAKVEEPRQTGKFGSSSHKSQLHPSIRFEK